MGHKVRAELFLFICCGQQEFNLWLDTTANLSPSTLQLLWLYFIDRKVPLWKVWYRKQIRYGSKQKVRSSSKNKKYITCSLTRRAATAAIQTKCVPQDKDRSCPTPSQLCWRCLHLEPLQTKPLLVLVGHYSLDGYTFKYGGEQKPTGVMKAIRIM